MIYDEKRPLFKAPGVKDIRAGKARKTVNDYGARTIDGLEYDEYLEIRSNFSILPEGYRNARHFLKKGPQLDVRVPDTMEACKKEKKGISARIREGLKRAPCNRKYRGYGWSEIDSGQHKIFALTDIITGLELFAAVRQCLTNEEISVNDYGQRCAATVPSKSGGESHLVDFVGMPTETSDNVFADGVNMKMHCDCKANVYHGALNTKYKQGENRVCDHLAAGYFAVAKEKLAEKRPRIQQNPIPVPKCRLLQFNDKLTNNVIKRRFADGRADTLSETEREILLWEYVQFKGPDKCFWFDEGALGSVKRAMVYAIRRSAKEQGI